MFAGRSGPIKRGLGIACLFVTAVAAAIAAPIQAHAQGALKYYEGGRPVDADSLIEQIPPSVRKQWLDRVTRLRALAARKGTPVPSFQENLVARAGELPGISYPIPVIRIVFSEQSFFDFNRSDLRPDARPAIDLISELVRLDGQVFTLVVGHTDAIGADDVNDQLSGRRAMTVAQLLASMNIQRRLLHTAAMGRRQAIAPNSTDEGRGRNRRVEFFISQSFEANLNALTRLPIRSDFAATSERNEPAQPEPSPEVTIVDSEGAPKGRVVIRPPRFIPVRKTY